MKRSCTVSPGGRCCCCLASWKTAQRVFTTDPTFPATSAILSPADCPACFSLKPALNYQHIKVEVMMVQVKWESDTVQDTNTSSVQSHTLSKVKLLSLPFSQQTLRCTGKSQHHHDKAIWWNDYTKVGIPVQKWLRNNFTANENKLTGRWEEIGGLLAPLGRLRQRHRYLHKTSSIYLSH